MSGYVQSNQVVHLPYLNTTISAVDTGKILITPQTANAVDVTYTLPALALGLHYRFINGAPAALNGVVRIDGSVGSVFGSLITGPTDGVALNDISGDTQIIFDTPSVLGDFLDFTCDGTNWFVDGRSRVAAGVR